MKIRNEMKWNEEDRRRQQTDNGNKKKTEQTNIVSYQLTDGCLLSYLLYSVPNAKKKRRKTDEWIVQLLVLLLSCVSHLYKRPWQNKQHRVYGFNIQLQFNSLVQESLTFFMGYSNYDWALSKDEGESRERRTQEVNAEWSMDMDMASAIFYYMHRIWHSGGWKQTKS